MGKAVLDQHPPIPSTPLRSQSRLATEDTFGLYLRTLTSMGQLRILDK